jgi:hypothetical protein
MYKCSKCGKIYEWYGNVYENPDETGIDIRVNCFELKFACPSPECEGEQQKCEPANGNLKGVLINLCSECMRSLLLSIHPFDESIHPFDDDGNCFDRV